MLSRLLYRIVLFFIRLPKSVSKTVGYLLLCSPLILLLLGTLVMKYCQFSDDDPQRGAMAIADGKFGESYSTPEYLSQGWDAKDSLWFYNTTQGSALLPYQFLLALEQPEGSEIHCERQGVQRNWLLCPNFIDDLRFLPQKSTGFNPDALPVGFVKDDYQGREYVGLTCSACHTGQVNFQGRALRIDGGPAMADMAGLLTAITLSMQQTLPQAKQQNPKFQRFARQVLARTNEFADETAVAEELRKWTETRLMYNLINHSELEKCQPVVGVKSCDQADKTNQLDYGYARLDAFGRIYNRVLQHVLNVGQLRTILRAVPNTTGSDLLLTEAQIDQVLASHQSTQTAVLTDAQFRQIVADLQSDKAGFPGLNTAQMLMIRNAIFNPPNAPVSFPFLWDISRSDYVQWNGLAGNAQLGPLGRNTGEVIGVFATLDWYEETGWWARLKKFSVSALASGQQNKQAVVNFKSSADLFNLQRLESHLGSLMSPVWPFCRQGVSNSYYLPVASDRLRVDQVACDGQDQRVLPQAVARGKVLYAKNCQSCHEVIDRAAADRLVVSTMIGLQHPESTDPTMAQNAVRYQGKSGNLNNTYQQVAVGKVVIKEDAPVVQILTAATAGVVATPDADKWAPRRLYEWVYALVASVADNPIQNSVKAGQYLPDTTAQPYNSLLAYRARPLNGIWATAPYLHNGSVPTLFDLLSCAADRPNSFMVGAREFDPVKVGLKSSGYQGFAFDTSLKGNGNQGHDYNSCALSDEQRLDLIEYIKTL